MRKSYILGLTALAAALLLGSCTKENGVTGTATGRTHSYTISFAAPTKTVLDKENLTPHFCDGDQIIISNGENCETVSVSVNAKGIATIETALEGELKAVYPPKAAWMMENEILGVDTPAQQDGTFESAHTAIAYFNSKATHIEFTNGASLFIINLPAGARKLTVQSLLEKHDGYSSITGICEGGGSTITVGDGTSELPSPCIVAVGFGAKLSRLSFDAKFTKENDGTGALLGISAKEIKDAGIEDKVESRMAYAIGGNEKWHPYVEIEMGGRTYKWATMNIGAQRESDSGEYFMWGGTTGHRLNMDSTFTFRFIGSNAPYVTSANYVDGEPGHWDCTYSKYSEDGKSMLELCDDAANANWGGAWRIPTETEAKMLTGLRIVETAVVDGVSGLYYGTYSNKIFLPFKGKACDSMLYDLRNGYIWTSSGLEADKKICFIYKDGGGAELPATYRYLGLPVRAIAE